MSQKLDLWRYNKWIQKNVFEVILAESSKNCQETKNYKPAELVQLNQPITTPWKSE